MESIQAVSKFLKTKGLSVSEFSKEIGIKKSSVYNYLNGATTPKTGFWAGFKDAFPEIDLNEFIAGEAGFGESRTELQRLRIADVDYIVGIATVPAKVAKKHDVRQSTIPAQLLPFFAARVKGLGRLNYLFGRGLEPVADQIGTNTVYNRHCEALKACKLDKIPGLTLNSWRHTGASVFVEQFGISVAQRQLGHASTDTTRIYAKPSAYIKDVSEMKIPGI